MVGSKMRQVNISKVLAVVLVSVGLIINVVPVATFYFGTYDHFSHQNSMSAGSDFTYYGTYGAWLSGRNNTSYAYGFEVQLIYDGGNNFHLLSTVYCLTGQSISMSIFRLPGDPFYASTQHEVFTNEVAANVSSNMFLSMVISSGGSIDTQVLKFSIKTSGFHTFAYPYVGYPTYYGTTLPLLDNLTYVKVGNQYLMSSLNYDGNLTELFRSLWPDMPINNSTYASTGMYLAGGNTGITQDWVGWLSYGAGTSFPVNVVLITAGVIFAMILIRRR